jgi:6-phosphogluconolactonase
MGAAGMGAGGGVAGVPVSGGAPAAGSATAGFAGTLAGSAGVAGQGSGGIGGAGAGGTSGMAGAPPLLKHVYVGCADAAGTLQSFVVADRTLTPLGTVLTDGPISNSVLNVDQNRLYVAYTLVDGDARVIAYTRDRTTGTLTPLGAAQSISFEDDAGGEGGGSGEGGGGGQGGGGEGGGGGMTVPTTGPGPQTLTLEATGRYLAIPNDRAGNVTVFGLQPDFSVGAVVSSHAGGVSPQHAIFSSDNKFMLVPYLGSNQISVYDFDDVTGTITLDHSVAMPVPMSGPRHLAMHPNGHWVYAINETAGGAAPEAGTLDFFTFDPDGTLTPVRTYDVPLPAGYDGVKNGAEIAISPSGTHLYVSMRLNFMATGELVFFDIATDGTLTLAQQESVRGVTPRHFSLSRDGSLLVVADQDSDSIVLMSVNPRTGRLNFLDDSATCDSPRFARFADVW